MGVDQFLAIIRAAIAARNIPKKSLARKCRVSKPAFSEMLHGDRKMPAKVRERLIRELGIGKVAESLIVEARSEAGGEAPRPDCEPMATHSKRLGDGTRD